MHREKWNDYDIENKIAFIEANKNALFHQLYIDFVGANPDMLHILEIGPGLAVEYPELKKIRSLQYEVLEISTCFIEYCQRTYPEIKITQGMIEDFTNPTTEYDLVRASDVLEHTSPIQAAIKNIVSCAKKFHITMFKWMTNGGVLSESEIHRDVRNHSYYSTRFPLLLIIREIQIYGIIDSATIVDEFHKTILPIDQYWHRHRFAALSSHPSARGMRCIITGRKK